MRLSVQYTCSTLTHEMRLLFFSSIFVKVIEEIVCCRFWSIQQFDCDGFSTLVCMFSHEYNMHTYINYVLQAKCVHMIPRPMYVDFVCGKSFCTMLYIFIHICTSIRLIFLFSYYLI